MYKILIVDDEKIIRMGLKTTVDWESMGFEVVAEASNALEALEKYREFFPQVIITDIRMAMGDGFFYLMN